jgi:hypothetical protein
VSHDDLCLGINRGLRVVALNVAVLSLEDAAFRIGEVALRFRFWRRRCRRFAGWLLIIVLARGLLGLGFRLRLQFCLGGNQLAKGHNG